MLIRRSSLYGHDQLYTHDTQDQILNLSATHKVFPVEFCVSTQEQRLSIWAVS